MIFSRNRVIALVSGLVALGILGYGAWYFLSPSAKYRGLVTTKEITLDDATRTYFEERIATTQAAINAAKSRGEEGDLNLYLSLASDAYSLGDLVTARRAVETQLKGNALNYTAWNLYGTVLEAMHDYSGARDAYKKAVDSGAASEEFYRDYITVLGEHFPGSDDLIKEILEKSVQEKGQSSWNMYELGKWYVAHGRCQEGIEHYEVAASLSPGNTELKNELLDVRKTCK